ncbi:MAG: class I SAM-dependent methyltransferase [Thalassobaculales bacterium]
MTGFAAYHRAVRGRPPRSTLVRAAAAAGRPGLAVDLGAGEGRDALPLLLAGWAVLAIDADRAALARLRQSAPAAGWLETRHAPFEVADWPCCDLVNASFSLFLCPPARLPALLARIAARLRPGGRFAGQLLGPEDGWAGRPGIATVQRGEIAGLLPGMVIEHLVEEQGEAVTPRGRAKRWHLFHLVARRAAAAVAAGG